MISLMIIQAKLYLASKSSEEKSFSRKDMSGLQSAMLQT
jgi:hypothetical protein